MEYRKYSVGEDNWIYEVYKVSISYVFPYYLIDAQA
jgi:hypothetical protein